MFKQPICMTTPAMTNISASVSNRLLSTCKLKDSFLSPFKVSAVKGFKTKPLHLRVTIPLAINGKQIIL